MDTHNPILNDISDVHADSYDDKNTIIQNRINPGHKNGLFFLRRFGHVITNIGNFFFEIYNYKCIIIIYL
jgi:hypothetical protein